MAIKEVPENLDWVNARAGCSMYKMFRELRNEVLEDIKKRNDARKEGERVRFDFGGDSGKGFSVFREGASGTACIDFTISDEGINVANAEQVMFTATITLNDQGRCLFMIGGKELEKWQVRRMALEGLFFGK